jgi:hypothetical protein
LARHRKTKSIDKKKKRELAIDFGSQKKPTINAKNSSKKAASKTAKWAPNRPFNRQNPAQSASKTDSLDPGPISVIISTQSTSKYPTLSKAYNQPLNRLQNRPNPARPKNTSKTPQKALKIHLKMHL